MTFHDLGSLGTADVIHKKSLTVRINMPWDKFSLKFAAELVDLSTGTIAVLQYALISKKDAKIKKEGDELDKFFNKVEAAQKKSPFGFGEGEDLWKSEEENLRSQLAKEESIQRDRKVRQRAQEAHQKEELERQKEELERQKAEEEHKRVEEERDRINRLKELVEVSIRLNRRDIGQYIGLTGDELFRRLVKWAKEFGFKLDGEDVVFEGGRKDEFIAQLEKEFQSWGKGGKK